MEALRRVRPERIMAGVVLIVVVSLAAAGLGVYLSNRGSDTAELAVDSPTAAPSVAPTAAPTPAPTVLPEVVLAINAGGSQVVDGGVLYSADDGMFIEAVDKGVAQSVPDFSDVSDPRFQTERLFVQIGSGYSIPTMSGQYSVELGFRDSYYTSVGERLFSVRVEDQLVLENLDLVQTAGASVAYVWTGTVDVLDGYLDIMFFPLVSYAQISYVLASRIAEASSEDTALVRLNCGSSRSVNSDGVVWTPDEYYLGPADAESTVDYVVRANLPQFMWTSRLFPGDTYGYEIPVGSYSSVQVCLNFSETYFQAPTKRMFSITFEESSDVKFMDIYSSAGFASPIYLCEQVSVSGQNLSIRFNSLADQAEVRGVAVYPL